MQCVCVCVSILKLLGLLEQILHQWYIVFIVLYVKDQNGESSNVVYL